MSISNSNGPLSVKYWPIGAITPYARNARKHSRAQIRKLQASLSAFGWTNPLLVDDVGNLVCGHGRLEAAIAYGETQVPVISLGAMSEADRRTYIIADNRLAEEANWSNELLRSELSGLVDLGYDIELTGFDTFEIDGFLSFDEAGDEGEEDRVDLPDEDLVPVCRVGDLWKIGDHWLGVGDCRDPDLVERLLDGNRVRLIQTDPPYGCRIAGNVSGNGKVQHADFVMGAGESSLPEMAMTLLRPAFRAIAPHCHAGAIAFVWTDWRACLPHALPPVVSACRRPAAWEHSHRSRAAAPPTGSPSMARHQTGLPQHGNSSRYQPPPEVGNANPSKELGPSMPASFTSMDSESEIMPGGNPPAIQSGRKPL